MHRRKKLKVIIFLVFGSFAFPFYFEEYLFENPRAENRGKILLFILYLLLWSFSGLLILGLLKNFFGASNFFTRLLGRSMADVFFWFFSISVNLILCWGIIGLLSKVHSFLPSGFFARGIGQPGVAGQDKKEYLAAKGKIDEILKNIKNEKKRCEAMLTEYPFIQKSNPNARRECEDILKKCQKKVKEFDNFALKIGQGEEIKILLEKLKKSHLDTTENFFKNLFKKLYAEFIDKFDAANPPGDFPKKPGI
ncbi:hypothetical protein ACFL35_01915 [Candidatus Riflebacteria bacterium]